MYSKHSEPVQKLLKVMDELEEVMNECYGVDDAKYHKYAKMYYQADNYLNVLAEVETKTRELYEYAGIPYYPEGYEPF